MNRVSVREDARNERYRDGSVKPTVWTRLLWDNQ
jgi:hypothetical protein